MTRPSRSAIRRFLPLAFVLITGIGGLVWSSCKDELNPLGPSNVVFPDSGVSYSQHVDPLFQQTCASSQCHGGPSPGGGLNLEAPSYRALIDHQPQLVLSGNGANSLLVQSLKGTFGKRMPLNLAPLNENQIAGIQRWIDEGAINN